MEPKSVWVRGQVASMRSFLGQRKVPVGWTMKLKYTTASLHAQATCCISDWVARNTEATRVICPDKGDMTNKNSQPG